MSLESLPFILPKPAQEDAQAMFTQSKTPFFLTEVPIFCSVCGLVMDGPCSRHSKSVLDMPPAPRAISSVPDELVIRSIEEYSFGERRYTKGIFAKTDISQFTVFGPLISPLGNEKSFVSSRFAVQTATGWKDCLLESDENCNWMKYMSPASKKNEQNILAYQQNNAIYFSTLLQIEPGQELRFWYSRKYGMMLGKPQLDFQGAEEQLTVSENNMKTNLQKLREPRKRNDFVQNSSLPVEDSANIEPTEYATFDWNKLLSNPSFTGLQPVLEIPSPTAVNTAGKSTRKPVSVRQSKRNPIKKAKMEDIAENEPNEDTPVDEAVQPSQNDNPDLPSNNLGQNNSAKLESAVSEEYFESTCKARKKRVQRKSGHTDTEISAFETAEQQTKVDTASEHFTPGEISETMRLKRKRKRNSANPKTPVAVTSQKERLGGVNYKFKCDQCDDKFRHKELLDIHSVNHGSVLPEEYLTNLACPACKSVSSSSDALIAHIQDHKQKPCTYRKVTDHQCKTCGKCFKSGEFLDRHIKRMHTQDLEKDFQCDICHEKFFTNAGLVSHKKAHSNRSYFGCPVCLMNFDNAINLYEHSAVHCVDGLYPCRLCKKTYNHFKKLRNHLRARHSSRIFKCEVCGYSCGLNGRLQKHMLIHSDKFEFKCSVCGRQFKRKCNYDGHMQRFHNTAKPKLPKTVQIHDGIHKPRSSGDYLSYTYKCLACKLGFLRKNQLVRHLADCHPNLSTFSIPELNLPVVKAKKFPCSICKKYFSTEDRRHAHIEVDHVDVVAAAEVHSETAKQDTVLPPQREVVYFAHCCSFCGNKFNSAARLLQHARAQHPDTLPEELLNPFEVP